MPRRDFVRGIAVHSKRSPACLAPPIRAFDAGAAGVMLSRQYDEMRIPNLRAAGKAIRERAPA